MAISVPMPLPVILAMPISMVMFSDIPVSVAGCHALDCRPDRVDLHVEYVAAELCVFQLIVITQFGGS